MYSDAFINFHKYSVLTSAALTNTTLEVVVGLHELFEPGFDVVARLKLKEIDGLWSSAADLLQ